MTSRFARFAKNRVDSLKAFVDERLDKHRYSTSSEYMRELMRASRVRRAECELALLLRAGLESGKPVPAGRGYWAGKRRQLARSTK